MTVNLLSIIFGIGIGMIITLIGAVVFTYLFSEKKTEYLQGYLSAKADLEDEFKYCMEELDILEAKVKEMKGKFEYEQGE